MTPPADFFDRTRGARSVLVIDPGVLGDTVHLVPALRELRRSYPQAELHVVCSPVGAEVLELARCADRLWVLERARRRVADQARVLWALRRLRFDVSVNFVGYDRSVIQAGLIGARHRLGVHVARRRSGRSTSREHVWTRWCVRDWVSPADEAAPIFEQRRQVLAASGFPLGEPEFSLRPEPAALEWAARVPPGGLHVSVNAVSTPLNEWPLEHWIRLARDLLAGGSAPVIVATAAASPREEERLAILRRGVADERLLVLPAGLPIARLAAVLLRCRLHVGPDSGVLHLAAALGVPTLGIFRDRGRPSWIPRGPAHRAFVQACPCQAGGGGDCHRSGRAGCLAALTPDVVSAAIREQLARSAGNEVGA